MIGEIINRLKANKEIQALEQLADNAEAARKQHKNNMKYGNYLLTGKTPGATISFVKN